VTVHPDLAARLGLTAGDEVAVGDGSGGSAVVVVDANVWPETLFLDDGVPGANVLSRPEDLKVLARRDA
jgi:anaerobic selenocysteine-containing dehydrogenase